MATGTTLFATDVRAVAPADGKAMVALNLDEGAASLHCMLTNDQAEALSKALIRAVDRARFIDAGRRRTRPCPGP